MGSLLIFSVLISAIFFDVTSAQLSPFFYLTSCPLALPTIQIGVTSAILNERRIGASLLRLHFHDCFVNGCDASVLLDDTPNFRGEKTAFPNVNSLRGFDVVDSIKARLEAVCPGVVSCADILAVAARDSVVALGGPFWLVPLGRRDSTTASFDDANNDLPPPFANLTELVAFFQRKGLSQTDLVALSGSHTIGEARCLTFRDRIHNETSIDAAFATSLRSTCPSSGRDNSLSALDVTTPTLFDAAYFRNLVANKGLLHSDQQLFNGGSTDAQVLSYVRNPFAFRSDFAAAMIKMGNISPLTGASGQIRGNCRVVN